ncbi:MAG: ATP-binding protein [Bacteroidota bacterium]
MSVIRILISIPLLLFCWSLKLNGQAGIQYWNTKDGLSNNTISEVLQDKSGYIWMATQYGLNRFDGYEFKQIRYRPNEKEGLTTNWVRSMTQDSSGNIWLAADYGGIHVLDPITQKISHYPLIENDGRESTNVFSIHCSRNQSVWVGSREGLFRKQPKEALFKEVDFILSEQQDLLDKSFLQIQEGNDDCLYLLTSSNIFQFDIGSETFTNIYSHNQTLNRIYIDRKGILWGLTNEQLIQFNTIDDKWTSNVFYEGNFRFEELFFDIPIYEDHASQLWIANNEGILVIDKIRKTEKKITKEQLFPSETEQANILCFFEDKHKNIWMGTSNGLLLQSPLSQRFQAQQKIPHIAQFNKIRAIEQIGDSLFVSNSDGIFLIDVTQKNKLPKQVLDVSVLDLLYTNDDYLYAVGNSFYQINLSNLSTKSFDLSARAWSLTKDRTGNVWISSGINGLYRFNPKSFEIKNYDKNNIPTLKNNSSINLLFDSRDRLWVSSLLSGVYVSEEISKLLDNEVPEFLNINYNVNNHNSLSNSLATSMVEDLNGDIWVGTDGGLNRISGKDYSIKRYLQEDGLEDEKIMGLLMDNTGNIWGSTIGHGIFRLNPTTERFTFFNREDGLVNDNFLFLTVHKNKKGLLYFGSRTQMQVIDPKEIDAIPKTPTPLIFTKYIIDNDSYNLLQGSRKKIELPANKRPLVIQYSTLNFYQADQTEYWYKIEELHDDWQPNGRERNLTFMTLPPNEYTLKIKAVNPDLLFEQDTIQLTIKIQPPWWKTTGAYFFYVFTFLAVVFIIYRFKLKQKLQEAEARRLYELDHLKTRFFTNITHEFRTPLTIIIGISKQLKKNFRKDIHQKATLLERNGQQLLDLVNQILDLSKLEAGNLSIKMQHGDLLLYLRYLLESFQSVVVAKNIRLHFLPQMQALWMDYDAEKVKYIIVNLLSNAIKHTPKGGNIYLNVREEKKQVIISCKDTGKGISEENLPYIFDRFYQADDSNGGTGIGLSVVKELVHLLEGTINVESQVGKGTTFEIWLPITSKFESQKYEIPHNTKALEQKMESPQEHILQDSDVPLLLIVEDNVDVCNFLIDSLKNDYRLEVANDGQEGIDKALESIPDVIVSDVMMPEKDGFELCQILKTNTRTNHIPIILLTAKADLDSRLDGLKLGADAYIYKPFEEKELHICIRKLLELRKKLQERFQSPDFWQKQNNKEEAFLKQAKQLIELHMGDANFGIPQLCKMLGISRPHLHRKLKALTNQSTSLFIRHIRLQKARHLLQSSDLSISEVAYDVGFKDPAYFSKCYVELFHETPSETRK